LPAKGESPASTENIEVEFIITSSKFAKGKGSNIKSYVPAGILFGFFAISAMFAACLAASL